jgi:hypothetical protein
MSDKDEGGGLFRRMARKVAAPARELVGMTPRETEIRPTEFDKAEMKAMIERKRRNDYVRKRELDTLRRIRREGLSGDQAQALTMQSSRMDESIETRSTQSSVQSVGIKAKIDAIERQMVGASSGVSAGSAAAKPARTPAALPPGPPPPILTTTLFDAEDGGPTVRVSLSPEDENETVARLDGGPLNFELNSEPPAGALDTGRPALPASRFENTRPYDAGAQDTDPFAPPLPSPAPAPYHAPLEFTTSPPPAPVSARVPLTPPVPSHANPYAAGAPAPRSAPNAQSTVDLGGGERVEVSEVVHDEALDEAVIAFAGGDFAGCEKALQALVGPRGERRDHDETWLVLFDLYRAIGQQAKFETVTMEYVERFHRSAPQWFSLPRQLAEATKKPDSGKNTTGGVGWVCPPNLDSDAVSRLDALSMQLPSPWVMDWTALVSVDVEGASRLQKLFAGWANQALSMNWIAGDKLFSVLQELAPTGVRDADPVYWMLRLEALRLAHRPDQFDDVAIDYCVTFEVSPPSWENARCKAQLTGTTHSNTRTLSLSVVGEAVTSFMDTSMLSEEESEPAQVQITSVELAGQLSGDLAELLGRLTAQVGDSRVVRISCALLMRVDFVAAGDLLNWVALRHNEGREIVFHETHRLVALMFGAMGINETARVQLRHI